MKPLRLLFLLLMLGFQIARAETADTFAAANEAYQTKDFGTAIKTYETLIRRGEYRPEIFYNLGLAHEGSVNPARAVLNYERALLLAPDFADAQARRDNLGDAPSRWWEQLPSLGSKVSFSVSVIAAWFLILALAAHACDFVGSRPIWSVSAVLAFFTLLIAGASFFLKDYPLASPDRAIILKSEKLRSNFTANSPSNLSLKAGQAVQITSVNGPWTECLLPDKTTGWVASSALERVVPRS